MKMSQLFRSPLWALLYCMLYLVSATDDDLVDFDFTDLKEIDWDYETDNSKELLSKGTTEKNIITFDDDNDLWEEKQVRPFDWREKVMRTALSKALMNNEVRQKFVEVMPILRVLSKEQRLALSALITAQINAKQENELKLSQVRLMFGDDKSLILPIVFDIANLVRNSAKKYIKFDYNLADFGDFSKTKNSYERRDLELTAEEDNENVGTLPAAEQMRQHLGLDGLEDFMSEEVLDPKEINEELDILKMQNKNNSSALDDVSLDMEVEQEEDGIANPLDINIQLQRDVNTLNQTQPEEVLTKRKGGGEKNTKQAASFLSPTTPKSALRRIRRTPRDAKEFVHKLVRSASFALNDEDLQKASPLRSLKLNTTAFASPKETLKRAASATTTTTTTTKPPIIITPQSLEENSYEPYQLVEDLAFASLNGSEVMLEDNEDKENDLLSEAKSEPEDELLPTPEELISGPRYRLNGNKLMSARLKLSPTQRKRVQVRARPKKGVPGNGVAPPKKCERFTASMCIKTDDYPM